MFLMKLSYPSCWRPVADKINMGWVNWSSSIKMSGKQEVEKELDTKSKFSIKYLMLAVIALRALQFGFCRAPRCLSASRRSPSPAWSSLTATRPRTPRLGRRSSRPWPRLHVGRHQGPAAQRPALRGQSDPPLHHGGRGSAVRWVRGTQLLGLPGAVWRALCFCLEQLV